MISPRFLLSRLAVRNAAEFAVIFALWAGELALIDRQAASRPTLVALVITVALGKTLFFGVENIRQLRQAAAENIAYHRFLLLMVVNIWQVIVAFGLDFHALARLTPDSFAGVNPALTGSALVFEYFYFSALNFMFFGFGDITPQTVVAKTLTLTEITLAFVTVIFLLSDFISLKESIRRPSDNERLANRERN